MGGTEGKPENYHTVTYELAEQAGKTTVTLTQEAKNLVRMGLATAESNTVAGRRRTVHAITDEGRRRVRDWLATPPSESALEIRAAPSADADEPRPARSHTGGHRKGRS